MYGKKTLEKWETCAIIFGSYSLRTIGAGRFNDLLRGKSTGLYETLEIPGWLFRNWMCEVRQFYINVSILFVLLLSIQVNVISLVRK